MENYCIFCGQDLEKGRCTDPQCLSHQIRQRSRPQSQGWERPISLRERRRQVREREEAEYEQTEEPSRPIRIVPYEEYDFRQEPSRPSGRVREREENHSGLWSLLRLPFFVCDYYRDPGKTLLKAARNRDWPMAVALFVVTVLLSCVGTLLFGVMYLEDFLERWLVCGVVTPVLAFAMSLLYGGLFAFLSPASRERAGEGLWKRISVGKLLPTVGVSSLLPGLLLLLSGVFAPMDKSLGVFQFFALAITLAWMISLLFSLFTVYGGGFSLSSLLLTVIFMVMAFLIMRTLWVWYLTEEWGFKFYIPLSIFFY